MSTYGTPFAETEALLAVMRVLDGLDEDEVPDYAEAEAILDDFLPGELKSLALAANELRLLVWRKYGTAAELSLTQRRDRR